MKGRIIGIDVARAMAIIGMIFVNFKVVFGSQGPIWLNSFFDIFDGKASATFVVLAGLSIALSFKSIINDDYTNKIRIFKRAIFLLIIGILYMDIWPADILHFYGIYMLITLMFIQSSQRIIIVLASIFILSYPVILLFFDYETGWNFENLEYYGLWTVDGFLRNLFINGFHPVFPWTAFMLFGYWLGRMNLNDTQLVERVFKFSLLSFVLINIISFSIILLLSYESYDQLEEFSVLFDTSPMPPLPIYMLNGLSFAFTIISGCIILSKKYKDNLIVNYLASAGKLSLSIYVAHVIVGMGFFEIILPKKIGNFSITFSILYSIIFSLLCVLFANYWIKLKKLGPLEYLMRKITG